MGTTADIDTADGDCAWSSELGLLERIGDPVLTALTRLARSITGAEGAAVHMFDAEYQRRIAAVGTPLVDHPEGDSMCRMVVRGGTRIVTNDATKDVALSTRRS